MSSPNIGTTVQPKDDSNPFTSITPEEEGNDLASTPGSLDIGGDVSIPTATQQRWNGNPMDWESWPIGRPGPFVSEAARQEAMDMFQYLESERDEWSQTEEKVFHVAEFSSTGQSEFGVYCNLV